MLRVFKDFRANFASVLANLSNASMHRVGTKTAQSNSICMSRIMYSATPQKI
jgi:hypothetical protein